MLRRLRHIAALALVAASLAAATRRARAEEPAARIASLVRTYEGQYRSRAGVCVVDLRSGRTIVSLRAAEAMIPASNQKILTSAFALKRLGADFNFTTGVYYRGENLIVIGDFDPTIGDPAIAKAAGTDIYAELDKWAVAVRRRVGAKLAGDIILRVQPGRQFRHEDWPKNQLQRWYAAPVAQLNFHNNCFGVTFLLAAGKVVARVQPESYLISVTSRIRQGRRHIWSLRCSRNDAVVRLSGTVKTTSSQPRYCAANNPPLLLGRVLADRLRRAGVTLGGKVTTAAAGQSDVGGDKPIARTLTPLPVAMARANKRSLNMAAECIFLRAGDGTWAGSAELMARVLGRAFGLADGAVTARDGGGLSRRNRVTPGAMVKILASLATGRDANVFIASLPAAGREGTMRRRLRKSPYAGKVRAKTGYIARVSCLSGYVLDAADKPAYAFSILINGVPAGKGYKAKRLQDDICRLLADSLRLR